MWDSTEPGLPGFQVTIDDAGRHLRHVRRPPVHRRLRQQDRHHVQGVLEPHGLRRVLKSPARRRVRAHRRRRLRGDRATWSWASTRSRSGRPAATSGSRPRRSKGQPGIDAWVKPNEPQFFTEFGPPGPHVEVGFTRALDGAGLARRGAGPVQHDQRPRHEPAPVEAHRGGAVQRRAVRRQEPHADLGGPQLGGDGRQPALRPADQRGRHVLNRARPVGQLPAHGLRLGARHHHRQHRGQRDGARANDSSATSRSSAGSRTSTPSCSTT